jgi:hypothetical protein
VTPLNKKSGPTHRPLQFPPKDVNSIVGCSFIRSSETHPFFVGNSGDAFFFVGVSTHDLLDNDASLSYLPALALSTVLERLLFTR